MWKRFFNRSSGSTSGNSNLDLLSPHSDDGKLNWENPWEGGVYDQIENNSRCRKNLFSKPRKQVVENQNSTPVLRRSRSLSSEAFHVSVLGDRNLISSNDLSRSPCNSNNNVRTHSSEYPVRSHTQGKKSKARRGEGETNQTAYEGDSPCTSNGCHELSGNSSCSSAPVPLKCRSALLAHVSDKILDLYIDGEQQGNGKNSRPKNSSSLNQFTNENRGGRRPPRVQTAALASPTGSSKEISRHNSSREVRDVHIPPSRDWMNNDMEPESPQKLAKNVVERLSQVYPQKPKVKSREFYPDSPTTVEDIFEEHSDLHHVSNLDGGTLRSFQSDVPCRTMHGYCGEGTSCFQKQGHFFPDAHGRMHSIYVEEDEDVELHEKAKQAEERVMLLSEELEQDVFLEDNGLTTFTAAELLQTIRDLAEERRNLALEVSSQLQCRIAERASAKETIRAARLELDSRTRRLEKEKGELQTGLEKELDRRSSDWSMKLGKYQSEEQRFRERVRELAEQNVSLQKEVTSNSERERECKSRITHIEIELKDLTEKWQASIKENDDLHQKLSELQENFRGAEADRECLQRSYKDKEKESKELQKIVTRLQRTRSEQDKTINGLRQGISEEIGSKESSEEYDNQVSKVQSELLRLTGVEQNLRKEMESSRLEVESLRHENIYLLGRLQDSGTDNGVSSFKLDQVLQARVDCLQNQGLSLFDESRHLCAKLLEFIKRNMGQSLAKLSGVENIEEIKKNGLGRYFVVESDMKIHSFKRGIENLKRSLDTVSSALHEKSEPVLVEYHSHCTDGNGSRKLNCEALEEGIGSKLKAETILTSVLREKLLSQQVEVEQLQTELATAIRGHDIFRCEIQDALDTLSCVSHKMKDLELQMMRKDENVNQLRNELQDSAKELRITNSILPKVSEERDLMWEKVKQCSETNMLLNSEVNMLRKKIESLEENILLKEGEITILKDSLNNHTTDLFYNS